MVGTNTESRRVKETLLGTAKACYQSTWPSYLTQADEQHAAGDDHADDKDRHACSIVTSRNRDKITEPAATMVAPATPNASLRGRLFIRQALLVNPS